MRTASLEAQTPEQIIKNNEFLDVIKERMGLKSDAALSRRLEVAPPVISKMRTGTLRVGASLMLRVLDLDIMRIREIRLYVPH